MVSHDSELKHSRTDLRGGRFVKCVRGVRNIPQCLLRAVGNGLFRDVQVERHLYTEKKYYKILTIFILSERGSVRERERERES